MKKLTRLIYASSIGEDAGRDLDATVSRVLAASRANNGAAGVTGMLLTYSGFFLQALEGEDAPVQQTLQRVARDARHSRIQVIGRGCVSDRAFGRWAMCANRLSSQDDEVLATLDQRGRYDPYALSPASAFRLLRTIADIQERVRVAA